MNQWISTKDETPDVNDDGTSHNVMIWTDECDDKDDIFIGYMKRNYEWKFLDHLNNYGNVTHWMHLPEIPEDG